MMARHYCTYFDSNYLPLGLALHESLRRHAAPFVLHVLCLDDAAYDFLAGRGLEGIVPMRLADLEAFDPRLPAVKPARSRIEYYFTLTPQLVLYVMQQAPEAQDVTYLDADLWFFADPAPIFAEVGSGSVGVIAHRYPPDQLHREAWGIYNVGFLFFRNDPEGRRCLAWWRDRCLEWCHDRVEDGKFADQKYLDQWPSLFRGVVVIEHKGAGVAPWNQARYRITASGDRVYVDGQPLIVYHFHGVRRYFRVLATHGLATYGGRMTPVLRDQVYAPYIRALQQASGRARVGSGESIRHARGKGPLADLQALVRDRVMFVAGPVALETRLAPVLRPAVWAFKALRSLGPRAQGGRA